MRYAANTTVSVAKTRGEIEEIVVRYGATSFVSGYEAGFAKIGFEIKGRRIRFILTLPDKSAREFTHSPSRRVRWDAARVEKAWEQGCRTKWRALLLCIRAKLEAVQSGICTFDEEFLPYMVDAGGMTVAERVLPHMNRLLEGNISTMLALPEGSEEVIET